MSQWRRISLEEVPSCKRTIEQADSPSQMWLLLLDEFLSALSQPSEAEKVRQVYKFAQLCLKGRKSDPLTLEVWLFFYRVVGQFVIENNLVRADLPQRMSASDFEYWLKTVEHEFPKEKLDDAKRAFSAAKRKAL